MYLPIYLNLIIQILFNLIKHSDGTSKKFIFVLVDPKLVLDFDSMKTVHWGEGTSLQGSVIFVEDGFYDSIFATQPDDQDFMIELIQHYINAITEEAYQWYMDDIANTLFVVNSAVRASILKCLSL